MSCLPITLLQLLLLAFFSLTAGILSIAGAVKTAFTRYKTSENAIHFGYTQDSVWLKFTALNTGPHTVSYLHLGVLDDRVERVIAQNSGQSAQEIAVATAA